MQGLQNVGVHYLLWRVQDWLIPQINNNLAGLKEDIRIRQVACLSFLVAHAFHSNSVRLRSGQAQYGEALLPFSRQSLHNYSFQGIHRQFQQDSMLAVCDCTCNHCAMNLCHQQIIKVSATGCQIMLTVCSICSTWRLNTCCLECSDMLPVVLACRLDDARVELGRMSALADLSEPTKVGREIEDLSSKVDSEFQVLMKAQGMM